LRLAVANITSISTKTSLISFKIYIFLKFIKTKKAPHK
jgi:hypothetical protein